MSLMSILLTVCVVGILLYVINQYVPLDGTIKKILNAIVLIVLVVWLLKVFGLWNYLGNVRD